MSFGALSKAMIVRRCSRFVLLFAWCALVSVGWATAPEGTALTATADLLKKIESKMREERGWDNPGVAIEGREVFEKDPEFQELQVAVRQSWPEAMSKLETVAPSPMEKTLFLIAMESVPVDDYLRFLDRACDLAKKDALDRQLLQEALFPRDMDLRGVLDVTYDRPITKGILQKVRSLYASDANMVGYCDAALAGKAYRDNLFYYFDNSADSPPTLYRQEMSKWLWRCGGMVLLLAAMGWLHSRRMRPESKS